MTHQLQVEGRGKVRRSQTDVLLLCHATNIECTQGNTCYSTDNSICLPPR